jgi:hypothetical protein
MNKAEFDKACRELEPLAIKALERSLKEGGSPALKAAELLLAYTQGKPAQDVNHSVGLTINVLRLSESLDANTLSTGVQRLSSGDTAQSILIEQ